MDILADIFEAIVELLVWKRKPKHSNVVGGNVNVTIKGHGGVSYSVNRGSKVIINGKQYDTSKAGKTVMDDGSILYVK